MDQDTNDPAIFDEGVKTHAFDSLLCNTFSTLEHLALRTSPRIRVVDPSSIFFSFLDGLKSLRSFRSYATIGKGMVLPKNCLPSLEIFDGDLELLAAVCDSTASHQSLVAIRVLETHWEDDDDIYEKRIFPKMPRLEEVRLEYFGVASADWIGCLGKCCPDLKHLVLDNAGWEDEWVSIPIER